MTTLFANLPKLGDAVVSDELLSSTERCTTHDANLIVRKVSTAHGMTAHVTSCPFSGRGDCAHEPTTVWDLG